jgi:hypothetical protein
MFILSAKFLWNILSSNRNSAIYYHKFTLHFLHSITRHASQILTKQIFETFSNKNFIHVSPVGAELFNADGRTDGHEEDNCCFEQFCQLAKKNTDE